LAAAALLVVALASCTATTTGSPSGGDASSAAPSTTTPEVPFTPSPTTELLPDYSPDETLLGSLSSQRGINQLGPYHVPTGRISVYVRCYGPGAIHVVVQGVAEFDLECSQDPTDPGVVNPLDVRYVDSVTVMGSSENSNLWAMAVTSG
jgi:hypothetical protein